MLTNKSEQAILIDNNEIDNFLNQKILEDYGYKKIMLFKNANYALTHLIENDKAYHLVIVNISMPVMDGFEFIRRFFELNTHKNQAKVCLITSMINPLYVREAEKLNVSIIEKPLEVKKLISLLG